MAEREGFEPDSAEHSEDRRVPPALKLAKISRRGVSSWIRALPPIHQLRAIGRQGSALTVTRYAEVLIG